MHKFQLFDGKAQSMQSPLLRVSCLHVVFHERFKQLEHMNLRNAGMKIPERAQFYDNLLCGLEYLSTSHTALSPSVSASWPL